VSHAVDPFLRDSVSPVRRRIFAIVAPPKVDVSGKAIRRILISDNHPESLRLVSSFCVRPDDLAATRRAHPVYLIFALLLMLALSRPCFGRSSCGATHSEEGAIDTPPVASQNLTDAPWIRTSAAASVKHESKNFN
jgi:hypothetical protein